jgi:hypothetical protein
LLSWVYRKREPQRPAYDWENEEEEEVEDDDNTEGDLLETLEPADEPLESEGHETNDPILPAAPRIRYEYKEPENKKDDQSEKETD